MNLVYTLGFTERDTDTIAEALSKKGANVIRVDETPLKE